MDILGLRKTSDLSNSVDSVKKSMLSKSPKRYFICDLSVFLKKTAARYCVY